MLNDLGNPYMHSASTLCDNSNAVIIYALVRMFFWHYHPYLHVPLYLTKYIRRKEHVCCV